MKTLATGLETYSELDISKVGLYKHAENCEVILCAYDDEPVRIVDLAMGEKLPFFLVNAMMNKSVVKTVYNAEFEINVLTKYFGRKLDATQWKCTIVKVLSLGLPVGLDKFSKVLKMKSDKQKMAEGKNLVKYFSMPSVKKKNSS